MLFACFAVAVLADCRHGDAFCQREAGPASWCRREDFTCQGKPKVKCSCDPPSVATPKPKATLNHQICIDRVGPQSWCRDDFTCQGRPDVKCGPGVTAPAPQRTPAPESRPRPSPVLTPSTAAPSAAARRPVAEPAVAVVVSGGLNHAVCTAIDPSSWCKENGFCHKHDHVPCRGAVSASATGPGTRRVVPVTPGPTEPPSHRRAVAAASPSVVSRTSGGPDSMILWTEWPTLEEGAWPDYFRKLLEFLTDNCAGIRFHQVIMRVLDPNFQRERGELWQVSRRSSFYVDFLRHLPSSIEVHIYPYLLEEESASKWSGGVDARSALEGVFKYVRDWNNVLIEDGLSVRIRGVVCDKEEGRSFLNDMSTLHRLKDRYSVAGGPRLKFGLAIGFDGAGSIPSFTREIDNFYLEMYDWYEYGRHEVEPVFAERFGVVNRPDRFADILEARQQLHRHYERYREHDKIVFMWSLQNHGSNRCLYPLNDGTCGERNDFGSWNGHHFREFLSVLASRESAFAQRQHAMFQFSFVPHSWHPRYGCS